MLTILRGEEELVFTECKEVAVRKRYSEECFDVYLYTKETDDDGNPKFGSEVKVTPRGEEMIEIRTSCGRKLATVTEKKANWVARS